MRQGLAVSVVIPHRGEDQPLETCIQALRLQTFPRQKTEILIVLNEESQRSLSFPLEPGEKLLWQQQFYSYAARNQGILHAKGEIIALTDSDTVPSRTWLDEGVRALAEGVDIVAGRIDLTFTRQPLTPAACYEKLFAFDQEKNVAMKRATTANLFVKRASFDTLGLFEKTAESGEDFRWTTRATQAGARLQYSPRVNLAHPARETMTELIAKAQRVTEDFPTANTTPRALKEAAVRYWSLYVIPPSLSRQQFCTAPERAIAHVISGVVQCVKALFLLKTLMVSRRIPSQF